MARRSISVSVFVVAVAHCTDVATGAGGVLQGIAIGVMISKEGISILENCARCGIHIPERLLRALAQIRGEDANEKKTEKRQKKILTKFTLT